MRKGEANAAARASRARVRRASSSQSFGRRKRAVLRRHAAQELDIGKPIDGRAGAGEQMDQHGQAREREQA